MYVKRNFNNFKYNINSCILYNRIIPRPTYFIDRSCYWNIYFDNKDLCRSLVIDFAYPAYRRIAILV